jgi:hypothetical protein
MGGSGRFEMEAVDKRQDYRGKSFGLSRPGLADAAFRRERRSGLARPES